MTRNSGFPGSYIVSKYEIEIKSTHSKQPRRIKDRTVKIFEAKNSDYFLTKLGVFAEKLRVKTKKNSGQRRQNSGFPGSSDIARYEKPLKNYLSFFLFSI